MNREIIGQVGRGPVIYVYAKYQKPTPYIKQTQLCIRLMYAEGSDVPNLVVKMVHVIYMHAKLYQKPSPYIKRDMSTLKFF